MVHLKLGIKLGGMEKVAQTTHPDMANTYEDVVEKKERALKEQ